ncbi:MAG: dihydrofolate reductase [Opitutales bacterium]
MSERRWVAIAAMDARRGIGVDGTLPWHIPDEFRFFKETTFGHILLMGRRTWEELGKKPLPGREHWVVSRSLTEADGATLLDSLEAALELPTGGRTVFVSGGAGIYAAAMPYTAELLISHIPGEHRADTFFPPFEDTFPQVELVREHPQFTVRCYRRGS